MRDFFLCRKNKTKSIFFMSFRYSFKNSKKLLLHFNCFLFVKKTKRNLKSFLLFETAKNIFDFLLFNNAFIDIFGVLFTTLQSVNIFAVFIAKIRTFDLFCQNSLLYLCRKHLFVFRETLNLSLF